MSERCLCRRVTREAFDSDGDYVAALRAHHAVMRAATECKRSADARAADALDAAIGEFAKMYLKDSSAGAVMSRL